MQPGIRVLLAATISTLAFGALGQTTGSNQPRGRILWQYETGG